MTTGGRFLVPALAALAAVAAAAGAARAAEAQARSIVGAGALAPNLTPATLDADASYALPGRTKAVPGPLRVGDEVWRRWQTDRVEAAADAHYVIVLKEPVPVGTVLAYGAWRVAYLKAGAEPDAAKDDAWAEVAYPGAASQRLRVVPLPPGVTTRAIRLSGRADPDESGRFSASLALATTFAGRYVNVAPLADVRVSSRGPRSEGFQPDPRINNPEYLVDGDVAHRTWSCAERKEPLSPEKPEWIVLDWGAERPLRGCAAVMGSSESGFGEILVQRYTGAGRADGAQDAAWETVGRMAGRRPWRPALCWEVFCDFGKDVPARALRLLAVRGLAKDQAAGGEGADPNAVQMGEVLVFQDLGGAAAPVHLARDDRAAPEGVAAIPFEMPEDGLATIQILDERGEVVQNLLAGEPRAKGKQTAWWDLATLYDYWPPFPGKDPFPDAPKVATPGTYRWRGLWHPPLALHYLYSFYPLKKHGLAWITADTTGGWLADHTPPQDVVRTGDTLWVGTFCEAGHALLEADLDMRKLWGSNRIWLACPRVVAADGDFIYYMEQGGWVGKRVVMIQVNRKTKESRRLMVREIQDDKAYGSEGEAYLSDRKGETDIQGLAVVGDRAYVADRAKNVLVVCDLSKNLASKGRGFGWDAVGKIFDDEAMTVLKEIRLAKPGRVRPYDARRLAAVSDRQVVLIDRQSYQVTPAVTGLVNPLGLAVDGAGNFYVGEMDPVHQVKVFSPQGKLLRTIGKPGKHAVGPFDPDNLESPSGIDVDARGNVWVCEFNANLKRTSVWDAKGRCVNQVLGPTEYGGGGDIDPGDANHFFYRGLEFRRDPKTGDIRLTHITWRDDGDRYDLFFAGAPHNFGGQSPAYPFRRDGKLFFTSWQGWAGGGNTTVWVYDKDHVRPVAALGTIPGWLWERLGKGEADPHFGQRVMERVDGPIDFQWGGSPGGQVKADEFAVRWTGRIVVPRDGRYKFQTTSDDGVRLDVDGKRIIDNWNEHGTAVDAGEIDLKAGPRPVRLEFYEKSGGAAIRLEWEGPDLARQVVPRSALRAGDAADAPEGLAGAYYHGGRAESIFTWTDANDDGKVQPPEVQIGGITLDGKPWARVGATWQFRMNEKFEVAASDGEYNVAALAFFRVERVTKQGYPVWRLPTEFRVIPGLRHASDAVLTDRAGSAITLDEFVVSMTPEGRINWRYKNRWPGLHAGHATTAAGDEPGVLIAPTRFLGAAVVNDEVGEVVSILSNLGATYLMTADGLYVDRVFQDARRGLAWRMDAPPGDAIMGRVSLGDEHFGGTFQRVRAEDGKDHFRYVVGQPHCSVVELEGLEAIRRFKGGEFAVTADQFARAERLRQQRAYAAAEPKRYTIRRLAKVEVDGKADEWAPERIGGFALGYDAQNLYVWFEGKDDRAVFQNAAKADDFLEVFKTGDVVDVMLETRAGAKADREDAAAGDVRLALAIVGGEPAAILYDYVVPGTPQAQRLAFSSPWRTLTIDRVTRLAGAKIAVVRQGDGYALEAAVPLAALHLDPKATPVIRGDVGRVLSDQTGTRAVDRVYWSNQNTKIVSDVPSEARAQPNLWGTFTFEAP